MSRRLPVYLLLDTSGSMQGEPIASVNVGLSAMISALRQDPHALESVYLSLITFDLDAKLIFPLTPIESIHMPEMHVPSSGPTFLGAALRLLITQFDAEVVKSTAQQKGDWRPMLFVMTDGSPSDLPAYRAIIPELKKRQFGNVVACAAGPRANTTILQELTDTVVHLDITDSNAFLQFFKWMTSSFVEASVSVGIHSNTPLPKPPAAIQVVI